MDARLLKDRATALAAKGKYAKAAEAYEEYCLLEKRDLQAHVRRGDAWVKAGNKVRAIAAYQVASEGWATDGFLPRAIAASKLVLELDPTHTGVQKRLAELYAKKAGTARTPQRARVALPSADADPAVVDEALVIATSAEVAPPATLSLALELELEGEDGSLEAFTLEEGVSAPPDPALKDACWLDAVQSAAGRTVPESTTAEAEPVEESMAPGDGRVPAGALPPIPLFSDLPEEAFIALLEGCPLRRAGRGQRIIEQGRPGHSLYVICAGSARVFRTEGGVAQDLARLGEGEFFGEMALLSEAPRSASVEALDDETRVLEIPARVLASLSRKHPSVASALMRFCRERLLNNLLSTAPLFRPFTQQERRRLVALFCAREALAGEVLIREGERSDGLYVVLSGQVEVRVKDAVVATLGEGHVFGEISLLTRSPAAAEVRVARRSSLLRLPREDFELVIMSHPQVLELVAELTDERTRQNARLAQTASAVGSLV